VNADVAVLNVRMPDGSGIELCRELRARLPDLQCLMLTSYADDEALFDSIMAGAAGIVLQQVLGMDLVNAVRTVGSGGSLLDSRTTTATVASASRVNSSTTFARPDLPAIGCDVDLEVQRPYLVGAGGGQPVTSLRPDPLLLASARGSFEAFLYRRGPNLTRARCLRHELVNEASRLHGPMDGGGRMTVRLHGKQCDLLATWASHPDRETTRRQPVDIEERHGLRFAFYGRTSTEDYQDPASSQCWQRDVAENVIAGCGVIVAEFSIAGARGVCRGRLARRPRRC
jgi:hypothetical protein